MKTMMNLIKRFLRDEEGAELVEWIVFVAILVIGISAAVISLRSAINEGYSDIAACISNRNCT